VRWLPGYAEGAFWLLTGEESPAERGHKRALEEQAKKKLTLAHPHPRAIRSNRESARYTLRAGR